jgi:hypothetical protein
LTASSFSAQSGSFQQLLITGDVKVEVKQFVRNGSGHPFSMATDPARISPVVPGYTHPVSVPYAVGTEGNFELLKQDTTF